MSLSRKQRMAAMLALSFGAIGTASADNDAFHYSNASLPSQSSWMFTVDDNTPLNHLSIPGTYASAVRTHDLRHQAQTLTLSQQLAAGVRFLDLAIREQGGKVVVAHKGRAQMLLADAYLEVATFLHQNRSETVFIWLHQDDDFNTNGRDLPRLANGFVQQFAPFSVNKKVDPGEPLRNMRGKIVWLREPGVLLPGIDFGVFAKQNQFHLGGHDDLYSKWSAVKGHIAARINPMQSWPSFNNLAGGGAVDTFFVASGRNNPGDTTRRETGHKRPGSGGVFADFPCGAPRFGGGCTIEYEGTNTLTRNRMKDSDLPYVGFVAAAFPGPGLIARTIDVNRTNKRMVNATHGQCLDIEGGPLRGHRALAWNCHGGYNQRVTVRANEIRINHRCLDVEGGNVNGKVLLWDCHGGQNQKWTIDGGGRIRSHLHGGAYCLTQTGRNAPLRMSSCSGTTGDQRFIAYY